MSKNNFEIMLLDVVACKWSHKILESVANELHRPGELQKGLGNISVKVMNESLARLVNYRMLTRSQFNEVPPRVEYHLTDLGRAAIQLLENAQVLKQKYELSLDSNI